MYWTVWNATPNKIQRANPDGSDPHKHKIQRANLDGSNIEDFVTDSILTIGIALATASQ